MLLGVGIFYGKTDEEESHKTLTYAADRGVTFWDTSDFYGTSKLLNIFRVLLEYSTYHIT